MVQELVRRQDPVLGLEYTRQQLKPIAGRKASQYKLGSDHMP